MICLASGGFDGIGSAVSAMRKLSGNLELSARRTSAITARNAVAAFASYEKRAVPSYLSFSAMLKCSLRWGSVWPAQPLSSALSPPLA